MWVKPRDAVWTASITKSAEKVRHNFYHARSCLILILDDKAKQGGPRQADSSTAMKCLVRQLHLTIHHPAVADQPMPSQ